MYTAIKVKFVTSAGMKVEGYNVSTFLTPEHCCNIEITKARKPFAGKTMLFAKTDMHEMQAISYTE